MIIRVLLMLCLTFIFSKSGFCENIKLSDFLNNDYKKCPLVLIEGDCVLEQKREELSQIIHADESNEKKLSSIAAIYDYDCKKVRDVFFFTKRYSRENEIPCVTFEELKDYAYCA